MLVITSSTQSITLLMITVSAAYISELLYNAIYRKDFIFSWETLLQGILIGLFIPAAYPGMIAFSITFFVLLLQKVIFSDFAQSWANPIVFALIVIYFFAPEFFPDFLLIPEYFQYPNTGIRLFNEGIISVSPIDISITNTLNRVVFNRFGIFIPEGYVTLLWDSQSSIPAFRFNALTLLASSVLIVTKTIDYVIPLLFLTVYALLVYLFSLYPYGDILGSGDILLALLTSGTLFTAFFLLGWFGTLPTTYSGKIIYGVCAGVFAFLLCGPGTSSMGSIFVIMLLNILSAMIKSTEHFIKIIKLRKLTIVTDNNRGNA